MSFEALDRRLFLGGVLAIVLARSGFAQHADDEEGGHSTGGGRGAGGHGGAQRGRPEDPHSGEDDHGDDHGDDHTDDEHTDDHGEDHASGSKGKGGAYFRGGRDVSGAAGVGRGRSLEDRVLKSPDF